MNTKRIISLIIGTIMLLTMIPTFALTIGAADISGDWTTYRTASEYDDPNAEFDPDAEPSVYKPEAGYTYTDEGFKVIPADYKDTTPFMTVQSKDKQFIKDGIYLQFRIDDYSYDGGSGIDQWICITLNTDKKVEPGNPACGGNWLTLIKGKGDGKCSSTNALTRPRTEDFGGSFGYTAGVSDVVVPLDDEGREIYTFEVSWNGSEYEMLLNGVLQPAAAEATELLEKLSSEGRFYVGITLMSNVKDGDAALTILKYGTSEDDAVTPAGSDEKQPEENQMTIAPIGDPSEIEANQPAILWSPNTWYLGGGNNCTAMVIGDNTWRVTGTDYAVCITYSSKRSWSWAGEDFPVFGMLVRNFPAETGQLWYSAGEIMGPQDGYKMPFSIWDGEIYEDDKGNEYIFIPADMTGIWEGRINTIRFDVGLADPENREFDICFAGMFRSYDEAVAYTENYLQSNGMWDPSVTKAPETEELTEELTEEPTEISSENNTEVPDEVHTETPTGVSTDESSQSTGSGCSSVIGFEAVVILALATVAWTLKKKD